MVNLPLYGCFFARKNEINADKSRIYAFLHFNKMKNGVHAAKKKGARAYVQSIYISRDEMMHAFARYAHVSMRMDRIIFY